MKTKLTFLLSVTFLFLFSGSSIVFADDLQDDLGTDEEKVKEKITNNNSSLITCATNKGFYDKKTKKEAKEIFELLASKNFKLIEGFYPGNCIFKNILCN